MKVCILLLVFAVGSQGFLLTELKQTFSHLGDAFKTTFSQVGEQAKETGKQLLDQLKVTGTQLAGQTLQSLLLGATSALTQPSTTDGKRQINIDQQTLAELEQFIGEKLGKYQTVFNGAVDKLTELGTLMHPTDILTLTKDVDEIVHSHHAIANNLLHELVEGLTAKIGKMVPHHKRSALTDLLGQVGQSLATFFQPHIQAAKQLVSGLGTAVTQTAQQMGPTTQQHLTSISQSHQQLVQHGKNALSALKDAVTDVLKQTFTNMQPHLTNIVQHAGALAQQSAGTLVSNLGKQLGATQPEQ